MYSIWIYDSLIELLIWIDQRWMVDNIVTWDACIYLHRETVYTMYTCFSLYPLEIVEESDTSYSDRFPGYPENLKMAEDQARFVRL